eukprot:763624-Hanusia_phi.AAC.1
MLHNGLSREICKSASSGMSMKAQSVHNAAARADLDTLSMLIQDEDALKSLSPSGWNILHVASQHDHERVIRLFVGPYRLDANARGLLGETPLHGERGCQKETTDCERVVSVLHVWERASCDVSDGDS